MTEQANQGESHFVPERARQRVIKNFKDNLDRYLDGQMVEKEIRLISLSFMQGRIPLEVSHFFGMQPTPFEYGNLDKVFERMIEPYLKPNSTPLVINEAIVLGEFKNMPALLKRHVGLKIQTSSTLYELPDSDGEKTLISKTRYFYETKDRVNSLAEIWKLQKFDADPKPDSIPHIYTTVS